MERCKTCAWRDECPGFTKCSGHLSEEEYLFRLKRFHLDELAEEFGWHTHDKWYLDEQ